MIAFEVFCHEWVGVPSSGTSDPCSFCGSTFERDTARDRVRPTYLADERTWVNDGDVYSPAGELLGAVVDGRWQDR